MRTLTLCHWLPLVALVLVVALLWAATVPPAHSDPACPATPTPTVLTAVEVAQFGAVDDGAPLLWLAVGVLLVALGLVAWLWGRE